MDKEALLLNTELIDMVNAIWTEDKNIFELDDEMINAAWDHALKRIKLNDLCMPKGSK